MKLSPLVARERFVASPVARLATADASGVPHAVPVTFVVLDDVLYFAVDHKPKSTWQLRRLRNIQENPAVTVLVDHYDKDWSTLWWARADGRGAVLEDEPERRRAVGLLCGKYDQYEDTPPRGLSSPFGSSDGAAGPSHSLASTAEPEVAYMPGQDLPPIPPDR